MNTKAEKDLYTKKDIFLVSKQMIPGTDFKFMLEFSDPQFIKILNVDTGER